MLFASVLFSRLTSSAGSSTISRAPPSFVAELPESVLLVMFKSPLLRTPPPTALAVLPESVLAWTVAVPPSFTSPPPYPLDTLPMRLLGVRVSVPK